MPDRITRVTTGSGDDGTTGTADGQRLPKHHPRIEALGAVDELNSHLGLLRAQLPKGSDIRELLGEVQQGLFDLGAGLAGGKSTRPGGAEIARMEEQTGTRNTGLPPLKEFVLPGGGATAAQCHVARAVCRRAERRVAALDSASESAAVYLNRLSDLLFVLARELARQMQEPEQLWRGPRPAG